MKKSFGKKIAAIYTPVWVVGSYGLNFQPNFMTVAWGGVCCSEPPCLAVSLRKATATYGYIMQEKAFTVNIPGERQAAVTDFFGMVSGRDEDKTARGKIAAVRGEMVCAPIVAEFPINIELKLIHTIELGLHTQFIGEIMDVKIDDMLITEEKPDLQKIMPFIYDTSNRHYYGIGKEVGKAFSIGKVLE